MLTLNREDQAGAPASTELGFSAITTPIGASYEGCTDHTLETMLEDGNTLLLANRDGSFDARDDLVVIAFE